MIFLLACPGPPPVDSGELPVGEIPLTPSLPAPLEVEGRAHTVEVLDGELVIGVPSPGHVLIGELLVEGVESFGTEMTLGDLDGDGIAEVLVGAPLLTDTINDQGGVLLFDRSGQELGGALGRSIGEQLGRGLTAGDFDGDGLDEVAAGAPFALSGAEIIGAGAIVLLDEGEETWIEGTIDRGELGWALAAGDLDGDGVDDLAACAANHFDDGAVLVWIDGDEPLLIEAERGEQDFTRGVKSGDVDGDGLDDLVVTVGPEFAESERAATTFVLTRQLEDGLLDEQATAWFELDEDPLATQGQHVRLADLDGDGTADLVIGNTELPTVEGDPTGGELRAWYGPVTGRMTDPDWSRRGTELAQGLGRAVAVGELEGTPGTTLFLSSWSSEGTTFYRKRLAGPIR